jgi:hypothetical protein
LDLARVVDPTLLKNPYQLRVTAGTERLHHRGMPVGSEINPEIIASKEMHQIADLVIVRTTVYEAMIEVTSLALMPQRQLVCMAILVEEMERKRLEPNRPLSIDSTRR